MASLEARKQAIRDASALVRAGNAFVSRRGTTSASGQAPKTTEGLRKALRPEPLIVTMYGGPGVGKSTIAALVFAELKTRGHDVEFVNEVAKDMTWEKRLLALNHQPYICAKQMFHMDRLAGQVDTIITDTSTLLALIYGQNLTPAFQRWIVDDYKRRNTLNILLQRSTTAEYNSRGRNQTEAEAVACDVEIELLLRNNDIPFLEMRVGRPDIVDRIVYQAERT